MSGVVGMGLAGREMRFGMGMRIQQCQYNGGGVYPINAR